MSQTLTTPLPISARPASRPWLGLSLWIGCLALLFWAAFAGIRYQHAWWDDTEPIRFPGDIVNAYNQGRRAHEEGVLNVYDHVAQASHVRADGVREYGLDYPPLRLVTAWLWYDWTLARFGPVGWRNTYEFHLPLLVMNRIFLALAALAAFGLVLHFRRLRFEGTPNPKSESSNPKSGISDLESRIPTHLRALNPLPHLRALSPVGLVPATLAALLTWFSPPATLLGFGWPQWDIIVPAIFLLTLLAACRGFWFTSGLILAVGAMYKGQLLLAFPLLFLWPLVAGRYSALPRLLLGFFFAAAVIAAPFMLHTAAAATPPELSTLSLALVCLWLVALACRLRGPVRWYWFTLPLLVASCLTLLAAQALPHSHAAWLAFPLVLATAAITLVVPSRFQLMVPAGALAFAILLTVYATGGSWNWFNIGIVYGTEHFPMMFIGGTSNLPAILASRFRIYTPKLIALTLPTWLGGSPVPWGTLLRFIFIVGSLACGVAMGIHDRRNNRRFLLAALVPWLLFVTFCPQIHERYPLYPALIASTLVALGVGWTLLAVALQAIAFLPILQDMLAGGDKSRFLADSMGNGFGYHLNQYVMVTHPGMGWALIALTCVCLFGALDLRRPLHPRSCPHGRNLTLPPASETPAAAPDTNLKAEI